MAEYGYTTVAEDYRGGRSQFYSGRKPDKNTHAGNRGRFSKSEMLLWGRLLICAGIFLALVVTKVNMPERFETLRTAFSAQMEQSIDYKAVFGAVGKAIGGEESFQQTMNDVYLEVFFPNRSENQAVETAVTLPLTDLSQQEPVNALLAFPQHWANSGEWIYQEGTREQRQTVAQAEETTPEQMEEKETPAQTEALESSYETEEVPEGVCMEQQVLNLSYTTPVKGWLSSPFGYREHPVDGEEKFHRGIDIAAPEGTDIVAFADGTVKATGESSSLGNYVMVEHAGNLTTIYAHCSKVTASGGTSVKKGDKIAEVGHTGIATGSHLHFAMQQGETYLNPIYYVTLEEKE